MKTLYTAGYSDELIQDLASRTAASHAAFFFPRLRPGMDLLDCGCGPGTITLDFAKTVAPAMVVGIDIEPRQIEAAKYIAADRKISNVQFQVASIFDLPFPDASFEAVFAHAVLEHQKKPLNALKEMHRVLKPGGIIGVRDADHGGILLMPSDPTIEHSIELWERLWAHNGGDPKLGRRHKMLLRETGFTRIEASASYDYCGTTESANGFSQLMAHEFSEAGASRQLLDLGWADRSDLYKITTAWKLWGENPDSFFARPRCEAVGWKK